MGASLLLENEGPHLPAQLAVWKILLLARGSGVGCYRKTCFYSLLLFHLCTNDTVRNELGNNKHDYMTLGAMVEHMGGQSVLDTANEKKEGLKRN